MIARASQAEIATKTCRQCVRALPREDFYRDAKAKDGLGPYCKACGRVRGRESYYRNHQSCLESSRRRNKTPGRAEAQRKWAAKRTPEALAKAHARKKLRRAVDAETIDVLPCAKCGNPESYGHHHDYSKPYEVEWLCRACHGLEHRRFPEGQVMPRSGPMISDT